jgi:hypothetical protein
MVAVRISLSADSVIDHSQTVAKISTEKKVSPSKIISVFTKLHHSISLLQNISDTGRGHSTNCNFNHHCCNHGYTYQGEWRKLTNDAVSQFLYIDLTQQRTVLASWCWTPSNAVRFTYFIYLGLISGLQLRIHCSPSVQCLNLSLY